MVVISNEVSYANYLYLRRQLGEQKNADTSEYAWDGIWPFEQKNIINGLLNRCHELIKNRDLSWKNYCDQTPTPRTYQSIIQWEDAPLFIKAAIIKPRGTTDHTPMKQFDDIPESEVTPW